MVANGPDRMRERSRMRTPASGPDDRDFAASGSIDQRLLRQHADVEVDDLVVVQQVSSLPVETVPAEHQDIRPLRMAKRLTRVLLDDDDSNVGGTHLLDALPYGALELRRETRRRLIEEEHRGIHHEPASMASMVR